MTEQVVTITYSDSFEWYELDQVYTVIFDPYVNKFLAIDNGGAGRYIEISHCQLSE